MRRETGLEASALVLQHHQIFLLKISCDEIGEMNYAQKMVTFDYYNHEPHLFHYTTTSDRTRRSRNGRTKDDDTTVALSFPLRRERKTTPLRAEPILHETICDKTHETLSNLYPPLRREEDLGRAQCH